MTGKKGGGVDGRWTDQWQDDYMDKQTKENSKYWRTEKWEDGYPQEIPQHPLAHRSAVPTYPVPIMRNSTTYILRISEAFWNLHFRKQTITFLLFQSKCMELQAHIMPINMLTVKRT